MDKDKILNSFFGMLLETLKAAKDFSIKEIPLVCKEYLTYNIYMDSFHIVLALLFLTVGVSSLKKLFTWDVDDGVFPLLVMVGISGTLVGSIMLIVCTEDLIKANYAPRVYLLDYAAHTLNTK